VQAYAARFLEVKPSWFRANGAIRPLIRSTPYGRSCARMEVWRHSERPSARNSAWLGAVAYCRATTVTGLFVSSYSINIACSTCSRPSSSWRSRRPPPSDFALSVGGLTRSSVGAVFVRGRIVKKRTPLTGPRIPRTPQTGQTRPKAFHVAIFLDALLFEWRRTHRAQTRRIQPSRTFFSHLIDGRTPEPPIPRWPRR